MAPALFDDPIKVTVLEREFHFKEHKLPDPNPSMNVGQVMEFYSNQYPELTNGYEDTTAMAEFTDNGKRIVRIKTSIGVKG